MLPRCQPADPGKRVLAVLREVAEDGDPPLCRYQAVRILGHWSAREDVCAFLVSCLSSPERLVRLGAAECMRTDSRPEVEPLIAARALEETDEEVLQALGC
jgi:HEAT repeat protein